LEGGKSGALGRVAGDAGVHLRELDLVGPEVGCDFFIERMGLQVLAQLSGGRGVCGIPDKGLTQSVLGSLF